MDEIVGQVRRVTDLIGEISSATAEQASGIGQVGTAVSRLDQTTQQNAALVEQSAAAAENLSQRTTRLVEAVRVFRSSAGDGLPPAAAAARARPAAASSAPKRVVAGNEDAAWSTF